MKYHELEEAVANVATPEEANVLLQDFIERVKKTEPSLEHAEVVSIVRGTLSVILETFIRRGSVTKAHPGYLAELLLEPLAAVKQPVQIGRSSRIQV